MPESMPSSQPTSRPEPRTVLAAKEVSLALVTYSDDSGQQYTQLAVVGDNSVHLLDAQPMGLSRVHTPQGPVNEWLKKGIFEKLGRKA